MWTRPSTVSSAVQILPSAPPSRSSSLPRATPMSLSAVLSADKPANSAVVHTLAMIATAINGQGKCILPFALLVAKTLKYLSSHETGDQYTVATATLKSSAEPALKRGNAKEGGWHKNATIPLFLMNFGGPRGRFCRFLSAAHSE